MKRKKALAVFIAALIFAGLLGACSKQEEETDLSQVSSAVSDPNVFPEGTTLGGKNIGGKTVEEALETGKKALEEAVSGLEVSVRFRDDTISLSGGDFAVQDILELSLPRLLKKQKAEAYELSYVIDLSQAGKDKLYAAAKDCLVVAKDATVTGYNGEFSFSDEQKGSRADMASTLKSVRQLLSQKHGGAIQASFQETTPKVTKQYLTENFKQLSSYSTVSTNTENGNSNMALALSHVNGTILQPGGEFSYNSTIGDSTNPDLGWKPAGGISGGVIVQMYGGGICQGSTTLYNAALKAGMEIVERDCHSMPSSYCPIGLDATVDYGNIDFRFKNPLSTPVYISAWMDGVTLNVAFYGCFPSEWDSITVGYEQTGSEPPLSNVSFTVDQSLKKGQYVRKSSGQNGYSARAWRTYYKGENALRTEELPSSYYAPTGTVYAVGEGTDTSKVDTGKESGSTEPSPSPSPSPSVSPEPSPALPPDPGVTDTPEPTPSQEPTSSSIEEPDPNVSQPVETLPPEEGEEGEQ